MGYEFSVTPLQLAVAYGAIANHGLLLTPTLVREVRSRTGEVIYRHRPEPVRQAVPPWVAAELLDFLREAASARGTGRRGQMVNYHLAGKTGTARISEGGRYINAHRASFVALFPAEDPQLVVVVKVDRSRHGYFGGSVAAPEVRNMLNEALAARRIAIDRTRLLPAPAGSANSAAGAGAARLAAAPRTVVRRWPPDSLAAVPGPPTPVPAVVGMSPRQAVLHLHRAGFRVSLRGTGTRIVKSSPAGGARLAGGETVVAWTD